MAERAEAVADGATARGRNGGLVEVADELLAHSQDGLTPLGPVEADAPDETGRAGERRDAQGAPVLGVLQAQDEAGLGQGDVGHRSAAGESGGAAEDRLDERQERLVLGPVDQGDPVQLQGHRIVRRVAALSGPAAADPDAEHARVAVCDTGGDALQADSGGERMAKQLDVNPTCGPARSFEKSP